MPSLYRSYALLHVLPYTPLYVRIHAPQSVPYRYVLFRVTDAAMSERELRNNANSAEDFGLSSDVIVFSSDPARFGATVTTDDDPSCSDVQVGSGVSLTWALCVVPADGWEPGWLMPMQVVVAVVSVIIAGGC